MRSYICNKDLYRAYLLASNVRYSGLALSEVAPIRLFHDAVNHKFADNALIFRKNYKELRTQSLNWMARIVSRLDSKPFAIFESSRSLTSPWNMYEMELS